MSKIVRTITIADLPQPGGHYSHAAQTGELLFISGQLPIGKEGAGTAAAGFGDQVRVALGNLLDILRAAGGEPADLVKVTAYIVGIANWGEFNTIYAEMMGNAKPARAIVPVPELHYGYLVEIDGIAALERTRQAT